MLSEVRDTSFINNDEEQTNWSMNPRFILEDTVGCNGPISDKPAGDFILRGYQCGL
jgi:hypothetical protein